MLSRFSDRRYVHPDPESNYGRFLDHLYEHLRESRYDTVFDPADGTRLWLSKHRDRLEATGALVAVEDWPTLRTVVDRAGLFERTAAVVPTPETYAPADRSTVEALAPDLTYPVVVRPRRRTVWRDDGRRVRRPAGEAHRASSPAALVETYRSLLANAPTLRERPPLVQEHVPGQPTAAVVLADDGDVAAAFQERRRRPSSWSGSPAVLDAVDDPSVQSAAAAVAGELSWTGPVRLVFVERPDGEHVLVGAEAGYPESIPFAVRCGVDVPWLHYRRLMGESVAHDGDYDTDVRWQRATPDLRWAFGELTRGHAGAVGAALSDLVRADHLLADLSDPLPELRALASGSAGAPDAHGRTVHERGPAGLVDPEVAADAT
jgi:predicted ATP-grasp superfamily ATP-dependent carboligase